MNRKSKVRIIQYFILALCASTMVVCIVFLFITLKDYRAAKNFYDDITIPIDTSETDPIEISSETVPEHISQLLTSYREIKRQYPNIVGYINIPAVSICYPVVQGTDNEYYTTHLISGEENKSGSIFLDFRVNSNPALAKNLIVYGHNMNNRTMFHNIRNLFEEDVFRSVKIEYVCDAGVFVYNSLSIYVTDTGDWYHAYDFENEETFSRFVADRASVSRIPTEYDSVSNLITLVTCSNSATNQNQRFIFHGKLIKSYTDFGEIT